MPWINKTRFQGMNSLASADEIGEFECALSQNGDLGSDSLASIELGYTEHGNSANTDDNIVRQFTYIRGDGTEVLMRVRDDATNYIVEYLNTKDTRNSANGEWSILEAGLSRTIQLLDDTTPKANFDFAPYNDTGTDQVVYGNGVEALRIWIGAVTAISSTTVNTVTKTGTTTWAEMGFDSTGTFIVNGNEFTYTGGSATTTLTGVSAGIDSEADGSGVAQSPDSSTLSGIDKGSILLSANSKLWMAGITATPNQVTFTAVGDLTDVTDNGTPDDGGFEDFPGMGGDIKGLSSINEWIFAFSEKKIVAFKYIFPSSTTRAVIRKEIADEGVLKNKAIKKLGDQIWYITPKGGLKRITQVAATDVFNVEDLTEKIRPTIESFVWDDASLEYLTKKRVFMAAGKSSSDASANDKVVAVYITLNAEGAQSINIDIKDWFIGDMAVFAGDLHFGPSVGSRNYKAFNGFSKNGAPIIWKRIERIELFGSAWERKWVKYVAVRGSISAGSELTVKAKYGLNGSVSVAERALNGTDDTDYIVQQALNTLGGFELGTEPLGGTIQDIGDLNPFVVIYEMPAIYEREFQLEFSTDGSGVRVVINSYGLFVEDAEQHIYDTELKA